MSVIWEWGDPGIIVGAPDYEGNSMSIVIPPGSLSFYESGLDPQSEFSNQYYAY